MKENRKLLKEVLKEIRHDMTDEEVLNLLADSQISVKPESGKDKYTLGQRAADTIAKFAGSWAFIFSFTGVLVLWMVINVMLASSSFDPISIHLTEPRSVLCSGNPGSAHYDEPEPSRGKRPPQSGKRL